MRKKAFTLVEVLIVVAIIGILAAMALPRFQGHIAEAKAATAKESLRTLRTTIELYAAEHKDKAPGYFNNMVVFNFFIYQTRNITDEDGNYKVLKVPTDEYPYGPYLSDYPENPFNGEYIFKMIADNNEMPATATGEFGWIYKPATKTIRLDWPGKDSDGIAYYDY